MKRRNFITATLLSIPAFSFAGFNFWGNKTVRNTTKKGFLIRANESRFDGIQKTMTNDLLRCVISNKDSDGQLLFGTTMPDALRRKGGPPLHIHKHQEEVFFVLSGEFLIQIGDEIFTAKTGDAAFIPRGTPHTFANPIENNPGTLISMHFPGSNEMESYFKTIASGKLPEESEANQTDVGPPINLDAVK